MVSNHFFTTLRCGKYAWSSWNCRSNLIQSSCAVLYFVRKRGSVFCCCSSEQRRVPWTTSPKCDTLIQPWRAGGNCKQNPKSCLNSKYWEWSSLHDSCFFFACFILLTDSWSSLAWTSTLSCELLSLSLGKGLEFDKAVKWGKKILLEISSAPSECSHLSGVASVVHWVWHAISCAKTIIKPTYHARFLNTVSAEDC